MHSYDHNGIEQKWQERWAQRAGTMSGTSTSSARTTLPTAIPDPIPNREGLADIFRKAGAAKVTILKGRTLAEVESKEQLDVLREAGVTVVELDDKSAFIEAMAPVYEQFAADEAVRDLLDRIQATE